MATRRTTPRAARTTASARGAQTKSNARSTSGAPSRPGNGSSDRAQKKMQGTEALAAAFPSNSAKAFEFGRAASQPVRGQSAEAPESAVTASTLTERASSSKVGSGKPALGADPNRLPLDRVRADATDQVLTTNQAVPISDNQNSLKAGLRGPALLEDFILREKITHFDHERIPERIVHARGSGAHGFFECYEPLSKYTRASLFSEKGKLTPVFVRFSTVVGERGSADTVRDVRGFAVKFYTDEGNWDLVGNNIPVFFIQDAMKFPDLIHAAKPEPHFQMPQAATAHDTFWDFVSLMPESTHMLMWAMSDRALPRSYRMMQGFGVHTFRLVNAKGESNFVKFHWRPLAGTHSLDWDECVKLAGADPDFHRRDLWEAIEAGVNPEWELGMQIFSEQQAEGFSFDVLDPTKIVPEELVPVTPVGRMVLNRNPDNFFAETEQVAFCTAHIVPGLDFSHDPLLAGRIHSYVDTQISRLGGPNFHEIPINAPVAAAHNNQRDGMHRQGIARGRVAYEPNSLGGGCPFQAGMQGFRSFPQPIADDKVRGKPEKFADHYTQATLFWNSQSPIEKAHIIRGYRFELSKVQTPAIRERVLSMIANVDAELVQRVADGLGLKVPSAMPKALKKIAKPEVEVSAALSLFALPGNGNLGMRHVAMLVADGVEGRSLSAISDGLGKLGVIVRYVGSRLGSIHTSEGDVLEVDVTLETTPAVLYDAVVVPAGKAAVKILGNIGQAPEFLKDQYRHCKPMLVLGEGVDLLQNAGIPQTLPSGEADPGLLIYPNGALKDTLTKFALAIAKHRHFERAMDPPPV
jgi:catalase